METNMITKKGPPPISHSPTDDSIMELSLMMSRRQFEALERRARAEGMSVAQFLRRLVHESITEEAPFV
jgi:predicted DNA binding CopG/RHH family protein